MQVIHVWHLELSVPTGTQEVVWQAFRNRPGQTMQGWSIVWIPAPHEGQLFESARVHVFMPDVDRLVEKWACTGYQGRVAGLIDRVSEVHGVCYGVMGPRIASLYPTLSMNFGLSRLQRCVETTVPSSSSPVL